MPVSPGGLAALSHPGEQGWASAVLLGAERPDRLSRGPLPEPLDPGLEPCPCLQGSPGHRGSGLDFSSLTEVCDVQRHAGPGVSLPMGWSARPPMTPSHHRGTGWGSLSTHVFCSLSRGQQEAYHKHAEAGRKPSGPAQAAHPRQLCVQLRTLSPRSLGKDGQKVAQGCPPSQPLHPTLQPLSRAQACPTCPLTPMTPDLSSDPVTRDLSSDPHDPDLFVRLPARPEAGAGGDPRGTGPLDSGRQAESRLSRRPTAIHQAALSRERALMMLLLV